MWEFESLPPLGSFDPAGGFTPDYAGLLMFDEFVIDGEAQEILGKPSDRPWLGSWPALIKSLTSEGCVTVADVRQAASNKPQRLGAELRRIKRDPSQWAEAADYFNAVLGKADALLGDDPQQAKRASWEFEPDAIFGLKGPDGKGHCLGVVLSEGAHSDDESHARMYGTALDALELQVREVIACIAACEALSVVPFMWAPYRKYLDKAFAGATNPVVAATEGRKFFEIAFPAYAPTTVEQFAKFRRDKRIRQLREEIRRASAAGDLLDPKYPQRILEEVLRVETRNVSKRRLIGWIGNALGIFAGPVLGIAANVGAEAVSSLVGRNKRREYGWFYLISDGRGGS